MNNLTPKAIIEGMQASLVERGWCQGTNQNLDGECCVIGHFNLATGRLPHAMPFPLTVEEERALYTLSDCAKASEALSQALSTRLARWNDGLGRTKERPRRRPELRPGEVVKARSYVPLPLAVFTALLFVAILALGLGGCDDSNPADGLTEQENKVCLEHHGVANSDGNAGVVVCRDGKAFPIY